MPQAAGPVAKSDRVPVAPMAMSASVVPESYAKDALLAWFRGEFAAANSIIDALCSHLAQLDGGSEYKSVFTAIHRRRLNWIPMLQAQRYYSIGDVVHELKQVAANNAAKAKSNEESFCVRNGDEPKNSFAAIEKDRKESEEGALTAETHEDGNGDVIDGDSAKDDSPESEITDSGSQEVHPMLDSIDICSNHEDCDARREQIKLTKGYIAKEPVKGHMVNVVRGLKLYENVFSDTERSKLSDFVNELRIAGKNGELSGETFVLYNQQLKGNKRELIQLGVPIFGHIKEEETNKCQKSHIEPIPPLLQSVIEHLIQWHLISENRKPNGCIINFFDEGEYSQPFSKPPHLEQPVSTLLLSDSTMAFGRSLVADSEGNYKGPLLLSLKEGSLLIMRGNSADIARHVMSASPNGRVSITFFKVRTENETDLPSKIPPLARAMTLWQPGVQTPYAQPNGSYNNGSYKAMNAIPKWGILPAPMVMLAPVSPVVVTPRKMIPRGGTGVFLPWAAGHKKPARQLPPRAQKGRRLALPSPADTDPSLNRDDKAL